MLEQFGRYTAPWHPAVMQPGCGDQHYAVKLASWFCRQRSLRRHQRDEVLQDMLGGMSQASTCSDESRGTAFNGPPDVRLHIGRKREGRDRAQIDRLLPQTGASAYEAVASYLWQLKPVLKSIDRESEWTQLIQEIRERYRNRPRFMEVLDRLESRPIVSRHKGGG